MDESLCRLICCPDCNSGLSEKKGALECESCQNIFPLEDGIPLLFSQEMLKKPLYRAYRTQYGEVSEETQEYYSRLTEYMNAGLLERLRCHFSDYRTTIHTWNSTRKLARHLSTCIEFIGPTAGLTVLDLGASEGMLLSALDGYRVAFDISASHLKCITQENISQISGFAEKLPFKSAGFDVVVSTFLFEHILKPEIIANEITRVLKPSGRLILVVPFNENPHRLFELGQDKSRDLIVEAHPRGDVRRRRPDTLHLRNFESVEDLTRFFPELRLTKTNLYFYKRKRHLPKWFKRLLRPLRWAPDSFKKALPSLFAPSLLQIEMTR